MRSIESYITESAHHFLVRTKSKEWRCVPKTLDELREIIQMRIETEGPKCDLNNIDVSHINDMRSLFAFSPFNGDISKWDVSRVRNMSGMFMKSEFNGDISKWNVVSVKDMSVMFYNSKFSGDISEWDAQNVEKSVNAFKDSPLELHPEKQCKFH